MTSILIVEKNGTLKQVQIKEKDIPETDLYKKCGFKKAEGFVRQHIWKVKIEGKEHQVALFAKEDGKAGSENKYDFPPPVDNKLFFGACALVNTSAPLTIDLWNKIYEKLFGGFEDLVVTCQEDEDEEDELALVPKEKKTKQGYLKDGFVVDSGSESDDKSWVSCDSEEEEAEEEEEEEGDDDVNLADIGSELSEEGYDYHSTFRKS
jgi:hypothetical protein